MQLFWVSIIFLDILIIYINELRKTIIDTLIQPLVQAHLLLLHFRAMAIFTNWGFMVTLHCTSLLVPFIQQHVLISCFCVKFLQCSWHFKHIQGLVKLLDCPGWGQTWNLLASPLQMRKQLKIWDKPAIRLLELNYE